MKVIAAGKAENEFIEKCQPQLKRIDGKIGIPVGDGAEIIYGKALCGIINGTAVGSGTAFGKICPQKGGAKDPEAGKDEQNHTAAPFA